MKITSYAQNFEDVMLWRALKNVNSGFYIDVGAQHPIIDSVSKGFYENGWRGIHVEPIPSNASLLMHDRPDESVLQLALSDDHGLIKFYEVQDTGLSTGDEMIANGYKNQGFTVNDLLVSTLTLADIFCHVGERDIHWLKIDVECMEYRVISGWGDSIARPWIVVVESTLPNSQIESHSLWEPLLIERGYKMVYCDGLNRFYISENHVYLTESFCFPPNIFDSFFLSETTPYCFYIKSKFEAQQKKHDDEAALKKQDYYLREGEDHIEEFGSTHEIKSILTSINRLSLEFSEEAKNSFTLMSELLSILKNNENKFGHYLDYFEENISTLKKICTGTLKENDQNFDLLYRDLIASHALQINEIICRHEDHELNLSSKQKSLEDELIKQQKFFSDKNHKLSTENAILSSQIENAEKLEVNLRDQIKSQSDNLNKLNSAFEEIAILLKNKFSSNT